jgi:hypothetical protein
MPQQQRCHSFLGTTYQNLPNNQKYAKQSENIPKGHTIYIHDRCKIFQMAIKNTNIFQSKALKINPNMNFWHETVTSGNPAQQTNEAAL